MFTDDSFEKKGFDAETFEAKGGKRMYCPNCKTNRTWNRGFKKHKMDYSKGEKPRDFIFYVCQKCNYAHDPKTGKKMEDNWREMFGYDAETFEAEKLHPGLHRHKGKIKLRKGWTECQECDDLVKQDEINFAYLEGYGNATVCDACVEKYQGFQRMGDYIREKWTSWKDWGEKKDYSKKYVPVKKRHEWGESEIARLGYDGIIKSPYGAETFEAETERVCDYCEREAKDMGMVTFPDGLAVCDICFEEQSGYAETFEAESVLVVGEMDGKKPVVKAFGIGTKDKNNFTPDFIKTMEHPLPAKNNNYDWENHAETFGAEGMPRLGGQEVWVRVETQKIGNNEGRMDSEIAGRITGYFTSEFAAHTDAKKRLDEYEAIPQRFMNYLHNHPYRSKITVISHLQGGIQNKIEYIATDRHGAESFAVENDPDFDKVKADRNKDGEISDWERTVGNKVAKGIREGRKTSSKGIDTFAEPFEEIGISKPYARLGVIAAGITALAFGVNKLRK